ncbi:hypothetical protein PRJ_1732 [Pseudomonas sp. XWY-1]|nr:hypothetical protein PRJ_1732 [Pseudomonas sp. XWY-1]
MQAALPRRLAIGHSRHRRSDGRGDAAGTTALTALHGYSPKSGLPGTKRDERPWIVTAQTVV